MSLLQDLKPFQKLGVDGGGSKGILEFRFVPNLGLRVEAGTKLNKSNLPNLQVGNMIANIWFWNYFTFVFNNNFQ